MQRPNIGLTMFPILIPTVAVTSNSLQTDGEVEASPFYVRRVAMDGISKKLMVQIAQAESGVETILEIPPGENQALVYKALELAHATNTPVLLAVNSEQTTPVGPKPFAA